MSYRLLTFPISENTWSNWIARHPTPIVEFQGGQNACAIAAALFSGLIEEQQSIVAVYNQYLSGNPGTTLTNIESGISLKIGNIASARVHQGETIRDSLMRLKEMLSDNSATIIMYNHPGQGPISSHVNILGKLNGYLVVYEPNLNQIFEGDNNVVSYYVDREHAISLSTIFIKPEKDVRTLMSDISKKRDLRSRAIADAGDSNSVMDLESEDGNEEGRGVKRMIIKNRAEASRDIKQKKLGGKGKKSRKIRKQKKNKKSRKSKISKKNKKFTEIK